MRLTGMTRHFGAAALSLVLTGAAAAQSGVKVGAAGAKIDGIAIVHENTEYGTSVASVISSVFKANGRNITQDIPYSANTTDVQSQVLQSRTTLG